MPTRHVFKNLYRTEAQADKAIEYFKAKLPECLVGKWTTYENCRLEWYVGVEIEV